MSKSTVSAPSASDTRSNADRFIVQVVGYFRTHADRDDVTAHKAQLVFSATREHGVSLSVLATALAEGLTGASATKAGFISAVPSKASLSNYGKAWELATIAGVSADARSVSRLFTTVSASAVKPDALRAEAERIGALSTEDERIAAAAGIPTSKAAARKSDPATRKGEGDDATTDLAGSEAVTVSAVAQGMGVLAARIAAGHVSAAEVDALTAAWGKIAAAVQSLNGVESVETALVSL